jgi:hypothetical protein
MIGGELISGIETDELVGAGGAVAVVRVRPFRVLFPSSATELTVRLVFSAELEPFGYSFDLRRDTGPLLWRHDCHEGHEQEHGGPWHLHIGPDESHRVWSEPMTLASIADRWSPPTSTSPDEKRRTAVESACGLSACGCSAHG